ncbi:MAG: hypothetical protein L0Y72_24385, partial [Gemmataceae bacterium]|nr:hypothetical protein [Gemmataceae bacterium]
APCTSVAPTSGTASGPSLTESPRESHPSKRRTPLVREPPSRNSQHGNTATLVHLHRNVIPVMRDNVMLAEAILESYADVPDLDPREQR